MSNDNSDQFVTLGLDEEVFAVPVGLVREILDMRQPFRIPDAPAHLAGLIDVRGQCGTGDRSAPEARSAGAQRQAPTRASWCSRCRWRGAACHSA